MRFYWEVEKKKISKNLKWIFYAKGGKYRKWTGNLIDLVNWTEKAREEYKKGHGSQIIPEKFWYKKGITWGLITSNEPSFRILPEDSTFDKGGSSIFIKNNENFNYILSLLNSVVFTYIVEFFNPTINFQVKDIRSIPLKFERKKEVDKAVKEILKISKYDWNTFETAWDFKVSPLVNFKKYIENYNIEDEENSENRKVLSTSIKTIEEAYGQYKEFTNNQFLKLKENEEELNRIFIDIYGLQDELTSDVSDKDITIAKIFDTDDEINDEIKGNSYVLTKENVVKQFISYAVGCMFGRYSLYEEGLVFAGGEFDKNKYSKFIPDEDNCIPITDNEYFSDDIVTRFVEFVKTVYGEETLEENLKFIAQALSNKNDAPKDIIREYFLKNFYEDHLKRYKKRPIYWLYDAGKKNGFKALIYMHRYNEQTTAKVRIGYLHELQKHYERRASFLKDEIESNNNRKKAEQELKKIKSQLDECKQFDEKMNHLSSEYISIDLDDGVKVNYERVQTGRDGKKYEILGKVK